MCGKTTFISVLSKLIRNKKILIIDFDFINNNLHSIFGVYKVPKEIKEKIKDESFLLEFKLKEANIIKLAVKVDRKIDLISSPDIIFNGDNLCNKSRISKMLEVLKKYYDLILIDTCSDTKYNEITNTLISLSSKVICLVEGNLMNIKNTMKLLNNYIKINKNINLVYNKKNQYTLNNKIMKVIFLKFKIIGTLSYDNMYNQLINKSLKSFWINKNIKMEFKKIIRVCCETTKFWIQSEKS